MPIDLLVFGKGFQAASARSASDLSSICSGVTMSPLCAANSAVIAQISSNQGSSVSWGATMHMFILRMSYIRVCGPDSTISGRIHGVLQGAQRDPVLFGSSIQAQSVTYRFSSLLAGFRFSSLSLPLHLVHSLVFSFALIIITSLMIFAVKIQTVCNGHHLHGVVLDSSTFVF